LVLEPRTSSPQGLSGLSEEEKEGSEEAVDPMLVRWSPRRFARDAGREGGLRFEAVRRIERVGSYPR